MLALFTKGVIAISLWLNYLRPLNNNDTYPAPLTYLTHAYGDAANGGDGGAFVEYQSLANGSGNIPKYTVLPNPYPTLYPGGLDFTEVQNFCEHWFANKSNTQNLLQLVIADKHDPVGVVGGVALPDKNISVVFGGNWQYHSASIAECIVHEIGHQFGLLRGVNSPEHIDAHGDANNIDVPPSDKCVMSYSRSPSDEHAEFDLTCIKRIRENIGL